MKTGIKKALINMFGLFILATFTTSLRSQSAEPATQAVPSDNADFRLETVPVAGGAEIVTIFARRSNSDSGESTELPLVSVLRDTLGDD
jgi:hypothetical protein